MPLTRESEYALLGLRSLVGRNGETVSVAPCPLHFPLKALLPEFRVAVDSVTLAEYLAEASHEVRRA